MNKKGIIFIDYYKTLCFNNFWCSLPAEKRAAIDCVLFSENCSLVSSWMRGEVDSVYINKLIAEKLDLDEGWLWDLFVRDCKNMTIDPQVFPLLLDLKEKYFLVLMTDNMDCFSDFTVPALGLNKYFDCIWNSFEQKILKAENNGKNFLDIAEKFSQDISSCILFDDSERVGRVFENIGGKWEIIEHEGQLSEKLKGVLETVNIW